MNKQMKRFILSVAFIVLLSSCGWYNKTFGDVESCTQWYMEKIYSAIKDDDLRGVIDITYSMGEWIETLTPEELEQFETYGSIFEEEHPYKYEVIDNYFRKHRDVIPK